MVTEIRVPKLGMSQDAITVVKFCVEDGGPVEMDEVVIIIETAKVSNDVCAPVSGFVFHRSRVKDKVGIGHVLAVVADSPEEYQTYLSNLPESREDGTGFAVDGDEAEEGVHLFFDDEGPGDTAPPVQALDRALDLTGRDILERIPFIGMRRTIADNLHSSLQTGAQLTIVAETDMTELSQFRKELALDYPDAKITYVDLLVKILPVALKEFPIVNAAVSRDEIICWNEYNIGVAMALEEGLVVPVIPGVDKKSLVQVSRKIKALAKKARNNGLTPDQFEGGTFTLSSGGKVDTHIITPIIKPPESAILAVGQIGPKPAVHDGQLAIRTMTNLCLTHDHRVIDGVPASRFLGRLKEIVEEPALFREILK